MSIAPIYLESCTRNDVPMYTKVLHRQSEEYFLYVKVDPELLKDHILYQVTEISGGNNPDTEIDISLITHDDGHPWYDFATELLNHSCGLHIYRMYFINPHTDVMVSRYFAYMVQDNRPDKPYDYMRREDKAKCLEASTALSNDTTQTVS